MRLISILKYLKRLTCHKEREPGLLHRYVSETHVQAFLGEFSDGVVYDGHIVEVSASPYWPTWNLQENGKSDTPQQNRENFITRCSSNIPFSLVRFVFPIQIM